MWCPGITCNGNSICSRDCFGDFLLYISIQLGNCSFCNETGMWNGNFELIALFSVGWDGTRWPCVAGLPVVASGWSAWCLLMWKRRLVVLLQFFPLLLHSLHIAWLMSNWCLQKSKILYLCLQLCRRWIELLVHACLFWIETCASSCELASAATYWLYCILHHKWCFPFKSAVTAFAAISIQ